MSLAGQPQRRPISAGFGICADDGLPKLSGKPNVSPARNSLTGPTIDEGITYGNVKRELVIHLPDGADQGGVRLLPVENVVEIELRDRPNLPFVRPFDNRVDKYLGMLIRSEVGCEVEVDCPPIPPLRDDSGPTGADTRAADFG